MVRGKESGVERSILYKYHTARFVPISSCTPYRERHGYTKMKMWKTQTIFTRIVSFYILLYKMCFVDSYTISYWPTNCAANKDIGSLNVKTIVVSEGLLIKTVRLVRGHSMAMRRS